MFQMEITQMKLIEKYNDSKFVDNLLVQKLKQENLDSKKPPESPPEHWRKKKENLS